MHNTAAAGELFQVHRDINPGRLQKLLKGVTVVAPSDFGKVKAGKQIVIDTASLAPTQRRRLAQAGKFLQR